MGEVYFVKVEPLEEYLTAVDVFVNLAATTCVVVRKDGPQREGFVNVAYETSDEQAFGYIHEADWKAFCHRFMIGWERQFFTGDPLL